MEKNGHEKKSIMKIDICANDDCHFLVASSVGCHPFIENTMRDGHFILVYFTLIFCHMYFSVDFFFSICDSVNLIAIALAMC